jgi:hypothetical protein
MQTGVADEATNSIVDQNQIKNPLPETAEMRMKLKLID